MESALHFLQAYYIYILGIISLGCLYLWDRFGTHMGRANDLLTKEDFREAIKEYDAAIASDPQDMHAFLGRAVAYEYLAEYEKAISDHTEALGLAKAAGKAAKEIAVFHYYRGGTYLKAGQFQNAIDDFTATINRIILRHIINAGKHTKGSEISSFSERMRTGLKKWAISRKARVLSTARSLTVQLLSRKSLSAMQLKNA